MAVWTRQKLVAQLISMGVPEHLIDKVIKRMAVDEITTDAQLKKIVADVA